MPTISKIVLPGSATVYDLRDADAQARIATLEAYSEYLGVTTTNISDGSTTNPLTINGVNVTAKNGEIVNLRHTSGREKRIKNKELNNGKICN